VALVGAVAEEADPLFSLLVSLKTLFSLPPTVAIIEVENKSPFERMDVVGFKNEAVEEVFAPLAVVVALVVVARRWNPIVFCFFDESIDQNTLFVGGVVPRLTVCFGGILQS
jgi:hypothetical protein